MTILRCQKFLLAIAALLTCLATCHDANASQSVEVRPLPIAELEQVLTLWLHNSGFHVSRALLDMGAIQLSAQKDDKRGYVVLKPRSPLATEVRATWTVNGKPDMSVWHQWDHHVSAYLSGENDKSCDKNEAPRHAIPDAVLSQIESVVCLKTSLNGNNDAQFSGFIVDKDGLILSTAHGLKDLEDITVILYDGRQFKGTLVKIDYRRDLALVDIDMKSATSISVANGRNLLGVGEWLYTVGCPIDLRGTVFSGMINGPPRRVDDQPLWQVDMEIHPGSSGSPVFDVQGNLVAVVKGRYRGTDTVGFLIPFETIVGFAKDN